MHRRIVVALAILAISAAGMAGCQKKQEQTTEAPATSATAPAAPSAPAAAPSTSAPAGGGQSGEALYKQHCAACHPDGGNTMNPKKTLHKKDMDANNVKSADDVVKLMRNPGPGMTKYDESTIPDQDAKAIGQYVVDTFK